MARTLKQGTKVYCNCYVGNRQDDRSFLCRGVIIQSYDSKVMKVLIVGVNTFTIGEPVSNRMLKALLGKMVPRNVDQISMSLSQISMKLYESGKWLSWEEEKVQRILKQQKEKQKAEKKDGGREKRPKQPNSKDKHTGRGQDSKNRTGSNDTSVSKTGTEGRKA